MKVAKAIMALENSKVIPSSNHVGLKDWISQYIDWIFIHLYGVAERDNGNNHNVCWVIRASVIAELVNNENVMAYCRKMYNEILLPNKWPARHTPVLYGGLTFGNKSYLAVWKSQNSDFENLEVLRNAPLRYPLPWIPEKNGKWKDNFFVLKVICK